MGTSTSSWDVLYMNLPQMKEVVRADFIPSDDVENALEHPENEGSFHAALRELEIAFQLPTSIVLTQIGDDEKQLLENFSSVLQVHGHLGANDRLFIDITHAIRTIPILQFLSLIYYRAIVQNFRIERIVYCLFIDNTRTTSKLIDVTILSKLIDYIQAAEEFNLTGTLYRLQELLPSRQEWLELGFDREHAFKAEHFLKNWSFIIGSNDLVQFRDMLLECKSIANYCEINSEKMTYESGIIIRRIFSAIWNIFKQNVISKDTFGLQYTLSLWNFQNHHYLTAVTIAIENTIAFVRSECNEAHYAHASLESECRNYYSKSIGNINKKGSNINKSVSELGYAFIRLRDTRNKLVHPDATRDSQDNNLDGIIDDLKRQLEDIVNLYHTAFNIHAHGKNHSTDEQKIENCNSLYNAIPRFQ